MNVDTLLLGYRQFATKDEIAEVVAAYPGFDKLREGLETAQFLLVFATAKQRTWLVATKERLYCILDDIRKDNPKRQWKIKKENIVAGKDIQLVLKTHDRSQRTGLLDIGEKQSWLFSKDLFIDEPIENKIREIIAKTMIDSSTQLPQGL